VASGRRPRRLRAPGRRGRCSRRRTGGRRSSLRFAWLSDLHIGSDRGEADLRASVADINALPGLSFVLVTGDITEMGSYENLSLAKEILDGLAVPYHIIPAITTPSGPVGRLGFRAALGRRPVRVRRGGFRFIGLSQGPVLRMGDGNWAPQDVRWLEGLLSERAPQSGRPSLSAITRSIRASPIGTSSSTS